MVDACVSDDFQGVEIRNMIDPCVGDNFWGVEANNGSDLYRISYGQQFRHC